MRDEEKKPKAAESESFSLSKPKQIEDVMDDIANEKPASSSEFDSMNEELKKRLAHGEKIRHENVKFIWDSSHARDAEEIARLKQSYEAMDEAAAKFLKQNEVCRDIQLAHLNEIADLNRRDHYSQKVRTDQSEQIAELTEENQRLREQLTHYHQFHESGKCQRMIDDLVVERKKLTAALKSLRHAIVGHKGNGEVIPMIDEALAADSGGAE